RRAASPPRARFAGTASAAASVSGQLASELPAKTRTPAKAARDQVPRRRAASNERRRSAAVAGRRQKYSRAAAADMPTMAASICARAPGSPTARPSVAASVAPSSRVTASARHMPQPSMTAAVPASRTTTETDRSSTNPPSTRGNLAGRGLPAAGGTDGAATGSDIEVGDLQCVVFDELAARLDHVAHQRAEDLVGGHRVLDAHAQQA